MNFLDIHDPESTERILALVAVLVRILGDLVGMTPVG